MKVRELRIGNYISGIYINGDCSEYDSYEENEELCKVVGIDSVGFSEYNIWVDGLEKSGIENYDSFEPIPITEEWLLKFGFEFNVLTNRSELDDWRFDITKPANYDGFLLCEGSTAITDRIKYVHQLQNLYFAFTGEELVLSEV